MRDMGPVRYEPPLHGAVWPPGHHDIALPTGPRWVAGPSRWHRVRSALTMTRVRVDTVYHLWCGQARFASHRPMTTDVLPTDGRPLCGTCEGRAIGAGHPSPFEDGPDLLFSPWRLKPPRWCPGGAPRGELAEASMDREVGRNVVRCAVCSEVVKLKQMSWTDWRPMPAQHEPGPGLVPGCPEHAWRELAWRDGEVWCRCGRHLYWPE